jgi:DNA helicase MCM9
LDGILDDDVFKEQWTTKTLRAYISHVKNLKPELTVESKEVLIAYYKKQRQSDLQNSARTTIRLLESLIR